MMMIGPAPARLRTNGFALVAVLWLVVAMSAVALDISIRTKTRRLASANLLDERRARVAALAGAEYARSRLTSAMLGRAEELRSESQQQRQRNSRNRGTPSLSDLFEDANPGEDPWRNPNDLLVPEGVGAYGSYSIDARDTGATLNLNEATEEMLRQFFSLGLRIDYAEADRVTQAILDWRDQDDLPRINGGEKEQYLRERLPMLPANRSFEDVAQLRYVLGMTEEIFAQAAPYLTVTSSGSININSAPEPVLLALPGMTPEGAAALVRLRDSGTFPQGDRELRDLLPRGAADSLEEADARFERQVTYSTNEVEIISHGALEGSAITATVRVVVVRSNVGALVVWRKLDL